MHAGDKELVEHNWRDFMSSTNQYAENPPKCPLPSPISVCAAGVSGVIYRGWKSSLPHFGGVWPYE